MRERPILFSGEMVRAILEGKKTQTRRVIKPQPECIYGITDDRIVCYHSTHDATTAYLETHSIVSERGLQGWERRADLLSHALQGIWQKGIRGLVSAQGPLAAERVREYLDVPQQCKGNKISTPADLRSVSREAARPDDAGEALGRRSAKQSTGESGMGNSTRELARPGSAWEGPVRREAPNVEVDQRRTFPHWLGGSEQSMQPPPCRAYSGPELLYDLRDCPYHIGQRLWVRESFNWADRDDLLPGETSKFCPERAAYSAKNVVWKADGATEHPAYGKAFWKPSIHMPRWASRLTLELTEVRVERVQDISEADAKAEGCQEAYDEPFELGSAAQRENEKNGYFPPSSYASGYAALWDQINAKRAAAIYAWAKNPWVWALEFKRVQL